MELYVREDGTIGVRNGKGAIRASGAADVGSLYDEGGLFGTCKQDPTLVNAMVGPVGFEGKMRWVGTNITTPIYQALTYIGTTTTAQASDCADCGKPRERRCAQSNCFGRICQQTNEMVIDDIGLMANRNVPRLALFGNITNANGDVVIGMGEEIHDVFFLNIAEAGYNLALDNSTLLWTGNPTNNLGGRREYRGFDLLINTGYFDVESGISCPAMDAYLIDYAGNAVGGLNSPSILAYMAALWRRIKFRASRGGFNVASLNTHIVMHPNQWDCVVDAVACEYGLVCSQNVAATTQQDAREVAAMRDQMRSSMTLRIDGKTFPVTLDSQINQDAANVGNLAAWEGDIYFITLDVNGRTITWGEYQDMNMTAGNVIAWFRRMFGATHVSFTDGGRFAVAPTTSGGFCFDARVLTKPRIMMLMPWLSGRVQNVVCRPLMGSYEDVTGSGGVYEIDGGVDFWTPNYLYGDCGPAGTPSDIGGDPPS